MKQKALGELGEQSSFCALCVLCGLGEKSSLNGRVSRFTSKRSHQDHKDHKAHKEDILSCESRPTRLLFTEICFVKSKKPAARASRSRSIKERKNEKSFTDSPVAWCHRCLVVSVSVSLSESLLQVLFDWGLRLLCVV
jgi:hypothetical protein